MRVKLISYNKYHIFVKAGTVVVRTIPSLYVVKCFDLQYLLVIIPNWLSFVLLFQQSWVEFLKAELRKAKPEIWEDTLTFWKEC